MQGVAIRLKCGTEVHLAKPTRHCHCIEKAHNSGLDSRCGGENQGFYDDKGNYLNRKEAMIYIKEQGVSLLPMSCGRINKSPYLFSEDVW